MDFLCSNLVKTIFTYWIGTVFNLILQLAEIYLLLKVTNPIFPVYHVTGTINVHYYATGKKRAYNRYFEFSGFGSLNKNWTYHHKYNTKRHGQVVVTGELNGNFGEISFPHTAF